MSNVRNSRTTHPRKQARRQRAADRFSAYHGCSERYRANKKVECIALGLRWSDYSGTAETD